MRIDDHLAKWIVRGGFFFRIDGQVLEETHHGGDPLRMNPILGSSKHSKPAVGSNSRMASARNRKCRPTTPGGMPRLAAVANLNRQQFSTMVFIDRDTEHVLDEFRQSVGDAGIHGRFIVPAVRCVRPGQAMQRRSQMGSIGADMSRGIEEVRVSQGGRLQLQQTPGLHFAAGQ